MASVFALPAICCELMDTRRFLLFNESCDSMTLSEHQPLGNLRVDLANCSDDVGGVAAGVFRVDGGSGKPVEDVQGPRTGGRTILDRLPSNGSPGGPSRVNGHLLPDVWEHRGDQG